MKEGAETEITLLLFVGEAVIPVQSLLPPTGKIDSTSLRGYVVTELVGWANTASRPHKESPEPPLTERSHWSAEDKDLELLGLKAWRDRKGHCGLPCTRKTRAYGKLRGK
jgi:hypothetical protein